SRGNLASTKALGSKNNLRGSFNNLSRFPSQTLKKAVERRDSVPQANAVVYENTYRLKPDTKFGAGAVSKIIDTVLIKNLTKMKYEHEKVPELISTISNEILAEVKKLEYDRYKIVVQVDIGEFKGQGIKVASRCVWDTTTDTWASGSFRNSKLFAVAMVYGCFYE
ncbi:Tctex-1 family-domain-containing protein, partial [Globomyces pollinis-pini]